MPPRAPEILVVDDSKTIRCMVAKELKAIGAAVSEARDGLEGLGMVRERTFDLIICDCEMPKLNGFDLCRRLRAGPFTKAIPVILISSSDADVQPGIQAGASDCVIKSRLRNELLPCAVRTLARAKASPDRRPATRDPQTILSLINTLEAREHYALAHSRSVSGMSGDIGRILGLAPHALKQLELAARLHDIGKIGIGDDILLKPGKLGQDDFAVVMRHPPAGANLLKSFTDAPEVLSAVLHHHERMDGSGYPHGLEGDAIPLWARIIAVADVHHALTSDRPFRAALTPQAALEVIRQSARGGLCPRCVDAFQTALEQKAGAAVETGPPGLQPASSCEQAAHGREEGGGPAGQALLPGEAMDHVGPGEGQGPAPAPAAEDPDTAFKLTDAFGRGLFLPLELYASIGEEETEAQRAVPVFPRRLCSSVLVAVKTYLIGVEKYDMINLGLIKIITEGQTASVPHDRDHIAQCYTQPRILRFLLGYYTLMLKYLATENKKRQFMYRISCDMMSRHTDEACCFDQQHFSMLTHSWARFVLDNIEHMRSKNAVLKIVFHYLPDQVAAILQSDEYASCG